VLKCSHLNGAEGTGAIQVLQPTVGEPDHAEVAEPGPKIPATRIIMQTDRQTAMTVTENVAAPRQGKDNVSFGKSGSSTALAKHVPCDRLICGSTHRMEEMWLPSNRSSCRFRTSAPKRPRLFCRVST